MQRSKCRRHARQGRWYSAGSSSAAARCTAQAQCRRTRPRQCPAVRAGRGPVWPGWLPPPSVRHGENRRKAGAVGQQVLGSCIAALHREVRKPVLPVKVERHAEPVQGIQTAVQPLLARAGGFGPVADDADDTVPLAYNCSIITAAAARSSTLTLDRFSMPSPAALFVSSRQGMPSDASAGVKHCGCAPMKKRPQAGARQRWSVRRPARRYCHCCSRPSAYSRAPPDRAAACPAGPQQSVLRALYNEGQPLRRLLLQMLGIGVGLVAVLRHNGQYFPACVLADAGVVVQHAGHCAHGIAGLVGNILDGQSCAFFRIDLLPVYHIRPKGERGGSLRILRGALYFSDFKNSAPQPLGKQENFCYTILYICEGR